MLFLSSCASSCGVCGALVSKISLTLFVGYQPKVFKLTNLMTFWTHEPTKPFKPPKRKGPY